jgi:hypothetical protein
MMLEKKKEERRKKDVSTKQLNVSFSGAHV